MYDSQGLFNIVEDDVTGPTTGNPNVDVLIGVPFITLSVVVDIKPSVLPVILTAKFILNDMVCVGGKVGVTSILQYQVFVDVVPIFVCTDNGVKDKFKT